MRIYESAENYLETILMIKEQQEHVRAIDIVNRLGFSKPTVSIAMRNLIESGYISKNGRGHLELTPQGLEIAEKIYERHKKLRGFLIALGIDEKTATEDACKMEHDISEQTFQKFLELATKLDSLKK